VVAAAVAVAVAVVAAAAAAAAVVAAAAAAAAAAEMLPPLSPETYGPLAARQVRGAKRRFAPSLKI
jgi:hypothetical protein